MIEKYHPNEMRLFHMATEISFDNQMSCLVFDQSECHFRVYYRSYYTMETVFSVLSYAMTYNNNPIITKSFILTLDLRPHCARVNKQDTTNLIDFSLMTDI